MSTPALSRERESRAAGKRRKISLLFPVYNEEDNVETAYATLAKLFSALDQYQVEFIFTDNHSEDRTFEKLAAMAAEDSRIKVLRFNRNYGFQRSLFTAYRFASGDASIQIDCDLQDPPDVVPRFLDLWEKGHDVVVGVRRKRKEPWLLTFGRRSYYRILSSVSDDEITRDAGDFRLVDRSVIDRLKTLNDYNPYVRGLISALAVNEARVPYDREERRAGRSKFPLRRLFGFAMDGILGHSTIPLRLASYFGLLISSLTFLFALAYLIAALFFGSRWPSGFATLVVVMLFGISLNAIFLGILGEYVSRIYQQVRSRPLVVVDKSINLTTDER